MAYVIDPTVMEVVPVPINVETKGALTAGMTVCDFRRKAPEGCHTFAALKLNVPQFWEMLISSVKAIGGNALGRVPPKMSAALLPLLVFCSF